MKRDLQLVRRILLAVEEAPTRGFRHSELEISGYDDATVLAHVELLQEAGLLVVELDRSMSRDDPMSATIDRLTWQGHEFLEASRNSQVWNRALKTLRERGGGLPFEVLKELLVSGVRSLVL